MSDTEYAYAVASVRAKEKELLTKSFMDNLADANSIEEVEKTLVDKGFSQIETVLADYMNEVWEYISAIAPCKDALQFMIVKNDFHNLKALIKGHISGNDGRRYCVKPCILDADIIYESIVHKNFEHLPEWIRDVAKESYNILTSTMDGQIFDMFLDTASLKAMMDFSKLAKCSLATEFAELFTALTNTKIAIRLSGTTKGNAFLDNAFCPCDTLDIDTLKKAVIKGRDDVLSYIQTTKYKHLCDSALKSTADFERECDNMLMELLDSARYVSMGPEPLICYYYAKETEWKMLRIAVGFKYMGMPSKLIMERMRKLYV